MNILHLTTYLQGGAGRTIHDLILYQQSRGCGVNLVTTASEFPGYCNYPEYFSVFEQRGIPFVKIDSLFKRDTALNLKVVEMVRGLIDAERIDLIHCHAAIPSLIALTARSSFRRFIPIVQTMQGWGTNKNPGQEEQDRIVMNGIDRVIPVSNASHRLLLEKGIKDKLMEVIPNSIGTASTIEMSDPDGEDILELRKKKKIIGCIGSVCARKNQHLLVEAMRILKDFELHCVFIGEGDALEELKALALAYGLTESVSFWGYKERADIYLSLFDILCLPSRAEGLPLTVLEGFRERVLVIGSRIPEISEVIFDGQTGLLFDTDNATSLAQVIVKALTLDIAERQALIDKAFELYEKEYCFAVMAGRYDELYTRLTALKSESLCVS